MRYQLQFRPYRRKFVRSLSTSHGNWDIREGIILLLRDETEKIARGEIAPLPWFGSETLESALDFCRQLGDEITTETIFSIPDELPACQFGFESAWEGIGDGEESSPVTSPVAQASRLSFLRNCVSVGQASRLSIPNSSLLPTGEAALHQWQTLWNRGYRTFKWKIGVSPIQDELKIFEQLMRSLPTEAKLRLDANGGLSWEEANEWLEVDNFWHIEFLEQPLPVGEETAMLELSKRYSTPLALDESVATLKQLETCYQQGWRGVFVIKPCIAGSPSRLRQFCQQNDIDAVFSSVFETAIGRQAALKLAAELSRRDRALGFGVNHWFNEDDETWFASLWKNP